MIIRSQDKKKILNFEQIRKIDCETNSVMADDVFVMGTYSTEEKAIKVLDAICNNYQDCKMSESGLRKLAKTEFVFQMPQDFEV